MKPGDIAIKARRYSRDNYCRHGGMEKECPIGTICRIKEMPSISHVYVNFYSEWYHQMWDWSMDISELDPVKEITEL